MSDIDKLLEDDEVQEEPKNKGGRPAWIPTEETLRTVEQLAGQGLNQQQIADALGIGVSTLMAKKNEFVEFQEAIKRGKAKGIAHVTSKLMAKVGAMDTTSILFYLKCQAGWKEVQELDIGVGGNNKIEIVINGGSPTAE